nr:MAG: internal scaffolding protein [Microvirus sp.]
MEKLKNEKPEIIIIPKGNGRKGPRIIHDYSGTISRTDQHTAHANDLNQLVKRYTIDELSMYVATKNMGRQPITGHDFSIEPSKQDAMNEVKRLKDAFELLPTEVKQQFQGPLDFIKFVDDPKNMQRMIDMGLMKEHKQPEPEPEKIQKVKIINDDDDQTTTTKKQK